jgi:hypothetical protein
MKGFIKQTAALCCFGAGLFTVLGCTAYREVVDPCWPERYNSMAAHSVRQMNMAQTAQGHKLEQTIWSSFFEVDPKTGDGTGILNDAGKETLRIISRKEPVPDFQLWLNYPHDVKDPARRDAVIEQRKAAIKSFLTTQTKLGSGDSYHIEVHDLPMPTYPAEWSGFAIQNIEKSIRTGTAQKFPEPGQGGTSK